MNEMIQIDFLSAVDVHGCLNNIHVKGDGIFVKKMSPCKTFDALPLEVIILVQ